VGNKGKFNSEGVVPVNSTSRPVPIVAEEGRWLHAQSIQICAVLAALLHDIGKATLGFQKKLLAVNPQHRGDPYRHEWISLRLFQAMVHGCNDDTAWLERLMSFGEFMEETPNWLDSMGNDQAKNNRQYLDELPPLAQFISWLIVTHHRLPLFEANCYRGKKQRAREQGFGGRWEYTLEEFYGDLSPVDGWVRNPKACDERPDGADFWQLKGVVMRSIQWQKSLARWARKARDHTPLRELAHQPISDPLLMHLSRLCLMLGDHNYSSLAPNSKRRVRGDEEQSYSLLANTDRKTRLPKQALDEHLLGVGEFTKKVAREIPSLIDRLPRVPPKYRPFLQRTEHKQFTWQNRAFELAKKIQSETQKHGFFGVNMASTGRGKTLGNARIMYALADPERGARFTIALGLRVLTLQTGRALRERLSLDSEMLAILVGGSAHSKLFELAENESLEEQGVDLSGSESLSSLIDTGDYIDGDSLSDGLLSENLGTLLADSKARDLIYAPVVSCTVDHIIQASESARGGRQIAPILRLLTSDLILDEPDDFDQADLPALTRLVHFAGLFGSKVLLSSATLPPDLVTGLYQAYVAGRAIWHKHMGVAQARAVPCAWFDENTQSHKNCVIQEEFTNAHQSFVVKRLKHLAQQPVRRRAEILPVDLPPSAERESVNMKALARIVREGAARLHDRHYEVCPHTNKQVSIGLVRLANVEPIIQLVQALSVGGCGANTQVHVCCYHASQLLVLRSGLEMRLDRILTRTRPQDLFSQPEIKQGLASSPVKNHIFMVVASPVAEVGRDHSYSWGIIEPSSMRSIIQLAGRIWRHQPQRAADQANLMILDSNIKALKQSVACGVGKAAFVRPGFEQDAPSKFSLKSHQTSHIITDEQLARVDSKARVCRPEVLDIENSLSDLEHGVIADLLNNSTNFVSAFWRDDSGNRACAHLQGISPFRAKDEPEDEFACLPDEHEVTGFSFVDSQQAWDNLTECSSHNARIKWVSLGEHHPAVQPWLSLDLSQTLTELANDLNSESIDKVARQFATVSLRRRVDAWNFHPWLGFWKR
ncbi:MAG: type I-F CRISPR-associated helicase Cas3f, partial [Cycloclasticus sp.]